MRHSRREHPLGAMKIYNAKHRSNSRANHIQDRAWLKATLINNSCLYAAMKKRLVLFGVLLLSLAFSGLAHGGNTFWQNYDWYILGAGLVLLVYVLFKLTKKLLVLGLIIAAIVIAGNIVLERNTSEIGVVGDIHYHTDFAMYIDGQRYNFSQEKYMSTDNTSLSNFVHLHDLNGKVIHKHASGVTLGFFFETLGMKLNDTCLQLDDGTSFCNEENKEWKMYVDGEHNDEFAEYDLQDEDRILLSYGEDSEEEIQKQIDAVSDEACIYSETCPERGVPPEEATCVGETCTVEG
jgi:hypothetical protein